MVRPRRALDSSCTGGCRPKCWHHYSYMCGGLVRTEMEETVRERLTSRKFAMLLTIFIFADILIWVGKMTSGEWLTLMSLIYGSYIIGNLYEKQSNG